MAEEVELLSVDNVTFNMTLEDYLLMARGPKHLALEVVVPITIIYCVIFLTGVLGNLAICLVIANNKNMHTATNYYLFSLAVSDVTLLLLGLPNDLSVFWQQYPWIFGEALCKVRALVSEMTSYTSVLTIVAFSMERYLAICHPLHSYAMSGLRRAVRIIAVLWLVSFISALPFAAFTKVNYIDYPPGSHIWVEESAFCGMLEENVPKNLPIYELSFFVFFFVPLCVIIALYAKIGLQIRTNSLGKSVDGTVHGETKKSQSRKSIIRMLTAVVITFFLCWAPFHAQRLLYIYGRDWTHYYTANEWLYYIAGCFYYFSSTVNPVLYNIMSVNYRNAFRATLFGRRHRELHSSFRESYVDGKWQRTLTWRNNQSPPSTRDVVVIVTPDKCCTTVTTKTRYWPKTLLRVTMGRDPPEDQHDKVCIQMETCI
ncbi:neuropeptides capa receptor-like [Macrosteles quadrilineatus]|uniref:neuropeptides capa receptor-like n=1 Tax=Macrosteles quadrilineatus TaxID=74068 RepID=UPI0023E34333|nr:neuropeptides capa receptor-like [Macrosteles quadrilineatus]